MLTDAKLESVDIGSSIADIYCFVCTGNTCRSPMAEAVFNDRFKTDSRYAVSYGISAFGEPISENAVAALEAAEIESTPDNDYKSHVSRQLDHGAVESAKMIIAMTQNHAMNIIYKFPEYASKVYTMPTDISDPYGQDIEAYKACLSQITDGLEKSFGTL